MSYELIDSEKLNQLILSIEVLNEQVRDTKVPRRWQIGIS